MGGGGGERGRGARPLISFTDFLNLGLLFFLCVCFFFFFFFFFVCGGGGSLGFGMRRSVSPALAC